MGGPSSTRPATQGRIASGVLVAADGEDAAAVCQVVDLVPAGGGMIVLLLLPRLADE